MAQVHWTQGSNICPNYINLYDLPINADMKVSAKGPVYPRHEKNSITITVGVISDRKTFIKVFLKNCPNAKTWKQGSMNSVNENDRNPCGHRRLRGH